MARLAWPLAKLKPHYEVVVVGSGYGGAIAAARLAEAGRQVCVLERGREFQPGDFPDHETAALRELQVDFPSGPRFSRTGLYDIRVNDAINVILGCGLGGTSLINANVAIARLSEFQHPSWPQGLRDDLGTRLADGFAKAHEMLKPVRYPPGTSGFPPLPRMQALRHTYEELCVRYPDTYQKAGFDPLPITVNFDRFPGGRNHVGASQQPCRLCGDCISGCNYGAKNTVAMNYLPYAADRKAEIYTGITVRRLARARSRWVVHFRLSTAGGEKFTAGELFVTADVVVLAAGTLGTTEILKRSVKESGLNLSQAQLGRRFTGNGNYLAFGYNGDEAVTGLGAGRRPPDVVEPVGPCTAAAIDLRAKHSRRWEPELVIEEGVATGATAATVVPALAVAALLAGQPTDVETPRGLGHDARRLWRHLRPRQAARHTLIFLVMAHDDGQGRMELRDDRIRIDWPGVSGQEIFERIRARLGEASGISRAISLPNPFPLLTVHPLGGCGMAEDADHGVVNHRGQVFRGATGRDVYPTLCVCDGAVIPRPLGIDPLLTISALAERTCAYLREDLARDSCRVG